jgi:hypothetical protein
MVVFGIAAIFVFVNAMSQPATDEGLKIVGRDVAMIEILLILVLAILGQTIILIRIYEQHEHT